MQINTIQFDNLVAEAKAKASSQPAWVHAIEKAAEQIHSNPYIELLDNGDVILLSASSGQIYRINGKCASEDGQPCKGYRFNKGVCYHRSLKRLIELYQKAAN
jgi:hypothetical protein